MNEFRFGVPVKICGETYWIDVGTQDKHARCMMIVNQIKAMETDGSEPERLKQIMEFGRELIDLALGEGACDAIFKGRTANVRDMTALMNFLLAELK